MRNGAPIPRHTQPGCPAPQREPVVSLPGLRLQSRGRENGEVVDRRVDSGRVQRVRPRMRLDYLTRGIHDRARDFAGRLESEHAARGEEVVARPAPSIPVSVSRSRNAVFAERSLVLPWMAWGTARYAGIASPGAPLAERERAGACRAGGTCLVPYRCSRAVPHPDRAWRHVLPAVPRYRSRSLRPAARCGDRAQRPPRHALLLGVLLHRRERMPVCQLPRRLDGSRPQPRRPRHGPGRLARGRRHRLRRYRSPWPPSLSSLL